MGLSPFLLSLSAVEVKVTTLHLSFTCGFNIYLISYALCLIRCMWLIKYYYFSLKNVKNSSKLLLWMPLLLINEYFCAYFVLFHHYMLIQQVLELFFEGNAITMDILKSATPSLTLPYMGSFLRHFSDRTRIAKMTIN